MTTELEWECFLKSNSSVIEFQTKQCGHDEKEEKPHLKEITDEQIEGYGMAGCNLGNWIFWLWPGLLDRCVLGLGTSIPGNSTHRDPVLLGMISLPVGGRWKMSSFIMCQKKKKVK